MRESTRSKRILFASHNNILFPPPPDDDDFMMTLIADDNNFLYNGNIIQHNEMFADNSDIIILS
jgi:hypothetical protein